MGEALTEALNTGDHEQVRTLLRAGKVAMITADRDGQTVPAVLVGKDDVRTIVLFSDDDAFQKWGRPEVVAMVEAGVAAQVAIGQGVDRILLDPAGPAPASWDPAGFRDLLEGLRTDEDGGTRLVGDQDFRPPSEATLAWADTLRDVTAPLEAYLLERATPSGFVAALGVYGTGLQVADVAHRLSGQPVGAVDVLLLDEELRERLATSFPTTRL